MVVVSSVRVRRLRGKFSLALFLGLFMTSVYMAVARPVTVCIGRVILIVVGRIIFGAVWLVVVHSTVTVSVVFILRSCVWVLRCRRGIRCLRT
jgi:hypothetical protein